jgi:hypothetical protein
MMMTDNEKKQQLAQIDAEIEYVNKLIRAAEDLEKLHQNDEFKNIILDGYLDKEAERIFSNLVEPTYMKRENLQNLIDKINSIRDLKTYFRTILINAEQAKDEKVELYKLREKVTAGKLDSDSNDEE